MVREGTDVSIFTYSRMRYVVMQAVAELEKRGYNPEVKGLVSRGPWLEGLGRGAV
jgi:pyruvate dehydrogenase E1 component beta subunit